MAKTTLTINVPEANFIEQSRKKEIYEKLAMLSMDDHEKLEKLIESDKAMSSFRKNWPLLKTMFGIKG